MATWAPSSAVMMMIAACAGPGRQAGHAEVVRIGQPPAAEAGALPGDEQLAREARLGDVLAVVLARNPELAEGRARVEAGLERAAVARGLPAPELTAELEHVPLARPHAVNDAAALMVGVRQMIPAPGSRGARAAAEAAGARVDAWDVAARRRDLARRTRMAFADYAAATAEVALHEEHVALGHGLVDALRAAYRAGRASQQDVLLADLEAHRLHTDVIDARQRLTSARALLNGLMARPADAPLGPPPAPAAEPVVLDRAQLASLQARSRPELGAADAELRRAEAERRMAAIERSRPDLMLEAGYVAMPEDMNVHGYRVMVSLSLPWLSGRGSAGVRAADRAIEAARHGRAAAAIAARTELDDGIARVQAARETYELVDATLLPAAERAHDAALAGLIAPQGSAITLLQAFRTRIDLRVERVRALTRLATSVADLESVLGTELPRRTP
jgi:outer membrane protein TolC